MNRIQKPIHRSKIRQIIGKEYYIIRRKINWFSERKQWANTKSSDFRGFGVFTHQSKILRPLRNVEMYLQENKRTNLELAISSMDNLLILPNETFSIWKNVGRPTKRKGYLEGLVLKQGTINKDTGGGLCQLGNLLFWIFAHSPLTVVERHRHGFDVFPDINRKVPFGAGATLAYNHIDLQIKNDTDFTFQIKLWMDKTHLHGALLCNQELKETYEVVERNHIIQQEYWGGYSRHNQIVQLVRIDEEEQENLLVENHAIMMYNPFLTERDVDQ